MTAPTFEDDAWYWVEKEGWIGDPPTIAPALYKAQSDAWYSFAFSGIPTREVKVLEPCRRAPAVPTRKQIEQYLYEQGAVTVSRDVAEAAGLARLAGKMQSAPAAPVPQCEPVGSVYTMEALVPGGHEVQHVSLYMPLPAGTKLYAAPQPPEPDHIPDAGKMVAAPVQLPENLREGAPYDNPAFEALARALGVWGTAQSAVCAQFWIAAKGQST